jgi:hypothetical protein
MQKPLWKYSDEELLEALAIKKRIQSLCEQAVVYFIIDTMSGKRIKTKASQ